MKSHVEDVMPKKQMILNILQPLMDCQICEPVLHSIVQGLGEETQHICN